MQEKRDPESTRCSNNHLTSPHAETEVKPGKLPWTPPSGLNVPSAPVTVPDDSSPSVPFALAVAEAAGVTDSLLAELAVAPPLVANVAAARAEVSEVGGGVGVTLTPGKGAEPSGTKDDERSFLLRRSEERSSSVRESTEALAGFGGAETPPGREEGSRPGTEAAVAAAAAGLEDLTPFEAAAACRAKGEARVKEREIHCRTRS